MAPLKRSRRVAETDDNVVDVREASSSFRQDEARKRVRVSVERPSKEPTPQRQNTPSSESDDEDESDAPDSPPQTQYELMRDAGFRHLQNPERDDRQADEKLKRRPSQLGNNMVAESGIIESITCNNFMCHERLHVELGPLINFIVGENGSGKSAVLTALTLCLGGKASDTNRGGSLRSFVKEGCDQGSLVVKIKNAGSDAYQPDIYGDSILVERQFSKTGSSGFKIKSATGRLISTKKQEVDEISEWYALQMGNPLTVLSQDNARQFLNSASPAQKYKYFISGVQLEQLDNDYKMSQDTLDKTLILRDDLHDRIVSVKKDMDDAQRLAETVQKNQSLREKARHYRNQLVWAQVVEQERALQQLDQDLVNRDQKIAAAEGLRDQKAEAFATSEEKLNVAVETRAALDEDRGTFEERISDAEGAHNNVKKELTDQLREERDAHSRLKAIRDSSRACEEKIKEEERRLGESSGTARAEKDTELVDARSREKDLSNQLIKHREEGRPEAQQKLGDAEQALRRQQQATEIKRKEVLGAEQQLRELEESNGSAYDGFDREITDLVKTIDSDKGFGQKPVGPLGAFVRLLKPEWTDILEKTFGEALNAFIVTNKQDQTRLSNLIRQKHIKRPPPIWIAHGSHIDTSSHEPDQGFDTILRVLQFDSDLVRSQLIINNQIEKIILVEQRVEAEEIMIKNVPPRNVAVCLCFHDGKGKRGFGLRITNRNGSMGTTPVPPTGRRPRLRTDSAKQVDLQKARLRQVGLEMREVNNEERLVKQEHQRCRTAVSSIQEAIKTLETRLRKAQAEVERISMEMDAFEGVDDRLVVLRTDLQAKQDEEARLGTQWGHVKLARRDLAAKVEKAKRNLEREQGDRNGFQDRVNKADAKVNKLRGFRQVALAQKNDAIERVEIEMSERTRDERRREEKAGEVEDFTGQAREMAPDRVHIPEDETHKSIEKKYEKIRTQLRQREERLGATDQQVFDRASEAKARYDDVMRQTEDLDETIASLKHAIEHRLRLWRNFQRQISARIRIQFNYLLSERGFRGKIDLDHRQRKVQIQIEPDETRQSTSGRNTKTLSGGEKSFSSICMLLSVWEAIGSPIRCLDEFDVFMDNVNRAISTNMLVDTARRSVSRQYILITPNAIEGRARLDKDVTMIRLSDPRQRTLI